MKSFSELPDFSFNGPSGPYDPDEDDTDDKYEDSESYSLGPVPAPVPVRPPRPSLELTSESWVERGAEVLGWSLARLEYWLSKRGWLRAWLRLSLFVYLAFVIFRMFRRRRGSGRGYPREDYYQ